MVVQNYFVAEWHEEDMSASSLEEENDEEMMHFVFILALRRRARRRFLHKKKKKRLLVRDIFKKRNEHGHYHTLLQEMKLGDRESYFRYLRMSPNRFEHLLNLVEPLITKEQTN